LNEAKRRSGRLDGRPKNPTVAEARQLKLEELVPCFVSETLRDECERFVEELKQRLARGRESSTESLVSGAG
jgi:hypothetical protein